MNVYPKSIRKAYLNSNRINLTSSSLEFEKFPHKLNVCLQIVRIFPSEIPAISCLCPADIPYLSLLEIHRTPSLLLPTQIGGSFYPEFHFQSKRYPQNRIPRRIRSFLRIKPFATFENVSVRSSVSIGHKARQTASRFSRKTCYEIIIGSGEC